MEVYVNDRLVFVGNVREVADYIGVAPQTLYNLRGGTAKYLPKKAKCDIVTDELNTYRKSDFVPVVDREIEKGFTIVIKNELYTIKDIVKTRDGYIYWINDIQIKTTQRIKNYNTLYITLSRALS